LPNYKQILTIILVARKAPAVGAISVGNSRMEVRGLTPGEGLDVLCRSRPALGHTQPPVQRVPALFPVVKRPGRGVKSPPPSGTDVKERAELCLYSPLRLRGLLKANFTVVMYRSERTECEYVIARASEPA